MTTINVKLTPYQMGLITGLIESFEEVIPIKETNEKLFNSLNEIKYILDETIKEKRNGF